MALQANSYGSLTEIGALVPRFSGSTSDFGDSERPTENQIESIVDQLSAVLNSILAQFGFSIPVAQADCVLMLGLFINESAAEVVNGINGSGRFGPGSKAMKKRGRRAMLLEDIRAFVDGNQVGLEMLGATRTRDTTSGIAYKTSDASGDAIPPMFQREAFGNLFQEWDT